METNYISILVIICLSLFIINSTIKKRREGIINIRFKGGMFGYISKAEKPLLFSLLTIITIVIFSILFLANLTLLLGSIIFTDINL